MKYLSIVVLVLASVTALAKDKLPDSAFQDATLTSFKTISVGQACEGASTTKGNISNDSLGSVATETSNSSKCSEQNQIQYTVISGEHAFVLAPQQRAWNRPNVLFGLLPGTHILIYSDRKSVRVRTAKDESKFILVEAR